MPTLAKFKEATETVYGPLAGEAEQWTPPECSGGHRGRYLWTDAFGVLNFITLAKESQDPGHITRAVSLADTVHNVLGRTRDGKAWLPGASNDNPVGGGLRIGKEDEGGSDGDGQYHHYLTLWMFALNRLSKATNDKVHNDRAVALAKAIHLHFFVDRAGARPRMVWKIAMDRSRPLVHSQGNLDPIDGLVVFRKLQAASDDPTVLKEEISDYQRIIELKGKHFVSSDTLDLGMTLWTSHWLADREAYFADLTKQADSQVHKLFDQGYLERPTSRRLAFREYGTCLGIGCMEQSDEISQTYRNHIITTWEEHRSSTPGDLRAISEVMRAAALIPGAFKKGYLGPEPEM
ncbi:uncharacterized protein LTR77_007646 [Saxophila tyrrhenica]|uniref:Uncharacterized protein n=1 Tax=Saxophila tyrrhenica TaxID=1690608 RepID=A0AAV9P617_9PEZI|nr:hypothetical protein LTR77_007646 [Saxophila tyrrhenica]